MDQDDIDFIKDQVEELKPCTMMSSTDLDINRVLIPKLEEAMSSGRNSGQNMKAIQCLLQTMFLTNKKEQVTEDLPIYKLKDSINSWFKDIKQIGSGSMSSIYQVSVISSKVKVVIKIDTMLEDFDYVLREYLVGLVLNGLRYQVPNFMYTYGFFTCAGPILAKSSGKNSGKVNSICKQGEDKLFLLYEKIEGNTMENLLFNKKLSFPDWLCLFIELLLALEVAQRYCRLTHYDLHDGNVMVVNDAPPYSVLLDDLEYSIGQRSQSPMILDFGFTNVMVNRKNIGLSAAPTMYDFMIPGLDMYFFLLSCIRDLYDQPEFMNKVVELFDTFPSARDIVKTLVVKKDGRAYDTYKQEITKYEAAHHTPLMVIRVIQKKYPEIANKFLTVKPRSVFNTPVYTSPIVIYNDIIGQHDTGIQTAIKSLVNCIDTRKSFILLKFLIKILQQYPGFSGDHSLRIIASFLTCDVSEEMIKNDIQSLNEIFNVPIPTEKETRKILSDIFSTKIFNVSGTKKASCIRNIQKLLNIYTITQPYLNALYTIEQYGINEIPAYQDWIVKFKSSDIYKFYIENINNIVVAMRWSFTLKDSLSI